MSGVDSRCVIARWASYKVAFILKSAAAMSECSEAVKGGARLLTQTITYTM
jgi:hypothetical protein